MLRARGRTLLSCAGPHAHAAMMHVPAAACAAQAARPFWRRMHTTTAAAHAPSGVRHAAAAAADAHGLTAHQSSGVDAHLSPYATPVPVSRSVAGSNVGRYKSVSVTVPPTPPSAEELARPGSVSLTAAQIPFRPRKPLAPRIQALIDAQLIQLRRKEHPEWLEKQHVRKMTLQERRTLLDELYRKFDLQTLDQCLARCKSPLASLQYIDRAHDYFIRVYTFAPLNVYHSMIRAASLYRQTLRVDEYFKLLLRFHAPTPRTLHLVMAAHAQCGHTERVVQLIEQMQNGTSMLEELGVEQEQQDNGLYDPTQGVPRALKKLHRNVAFKYPFTERCLFYLLQSHAVNDDSEAIRSLVATLAEGGHFYEHQVAPLRLTAHLADLLMHYYALHRMLGDCVALLRWVQRDALPVGPRFAYFFFDAFKREATMRHLQQEQPTLAMEEEARRARKEPAQAPVAQKPDPTQSKAFDPLAIPSSAPQQSGVQLLQAALAPIHPSGAPVRSHAGAPRVYHSPFPAEANSTTVPTKLAGDFPASPVRRQRRLLQPSPLDKRKEDASLAEALSIMVAEHELVPSANLVNMYLAYYGENFIPPGTFPDVMAQQCALLERELSAERLRELGVQLDQSDPSVADPEALESATPFLANARTYALMIQALMDREPLRSTAPSSLALRRAGPSPADVRSIRAMRAQMRERGVTPLLQTKINMMQLMAYEERWSDLYASFSLLWKADKLRKDTKLAAILNSSAQATPESKPSSSTEGEDAAAAAAEDDDGIPVPVAFRRVESSPFTCLSLLPVLLSLAHRPSLERMNLFLGIISNTKDFPLTLPFFQAVMQILADRGHTKDIIDLLKTIKAKYNIRPTIMQYNTLLASLVHQEEGVGGAATATDPQSRLVTLFQTFELMKMLGIAANTDTWHIMLTGCLHYGQLVDGQRLWRYLRFKAARPTLDMYTTYVAFLLKHGQLQRALYILRSQSFKDGMDWSLKECYLLLDYFQKRLLEHAGPRRPHAAAAGARTTESPATDAIQKEVEEGQKENGEAPEPEEEQEGYSAEAAAGSGLTDAQQAAVYVPTAEQLEQYAEIQTRCRNLRMALLAHEKSGGRLGRRGFLDLVSIPGQQPLALAAHKRLVSPSRRALATPLGSSKEEEEVLLLSTIPGTLFQRYMVPLMNRAEQFAGTFRYKPRHLRDQRDQLKLLAETLQAEQDSKPTRYEPEQIDELQPVTVPLTDAESSQTDEVLQTISDAIAAEKQVAMPASTTTTAPAPEQQKQEAPAAAPATAAATLADSADASVPSPSISSGKPRASSKRRSAAPATGAADAADAPDAPPSPEQLEEFARRKAAREALKAAKAAKKQAQAAQAHLSRDVDEMARPSGEQLTPAALAVDEVLRSLGGKADRTRVMMAPLAAPAHPAVLDGVDLCALHAEGRLSTLTIPQLKAVQLHPQLMAQPQLLVKGIKSHHLQVVECWIKQCECCKHNQAK